MAIWTRLFALIGAGAAARATGRAADPIIEVVAQEAWQHNTFKVLDLFTIAALIAQGLVDQHAAEDMAARNGYDPNKLNAAVQLALKGPPVAEALELWRRGRLTQAQVVHALHKAQIETQYHQPILDLFQERLDPAVVATAIQRTVLPNPGILPNQPSTAGSNVPPMPQVNLDPVAEAQAMGIDLPRLEVQSRIVGLPASPDLAARMTFRKIITQGAFNQAILEGNTRGEWAPFLFEGFRQIPTAHDFVEGRLRGWLADPAMYAGTALHGMSQADTDLLFKIMGRPIVEHQIVTGEARGGTYNGPIANIPTPFLKSLQESNIRPEWYSLAYANRYTYPSAFVLRSITQAGDITQAQAHQILLNIGWEPTLAATVSARWAGGAAAASGPLVKKAEAQLWSQTHKSYVANEIGASTALASLAAIGALPAEQTAVLALWNQEQALIRAQLTPAEIKKAVKGAVTNPLTGAAWTQGEAITALLDRGYSQADAQTFLAE